MKATANIGLLHSLPGNTGTVNPSYSWSGIFPSWFSSWLLECAVLAVFHPKPERDSGENRHRRQDHHEYRLDGHDTACRQATDAEDDNRNQNSARARKVEFHTN